MRGRLNAWGLDVVADAMHRIYGRRKRSLFETLPADLVELGPGAGANLRYYAPGTRVLAVEPNDLMHPRLRRRAGERGLVLEVHTGGAEALPLPDASVDAVVCTLVLCSVRDPDRVVSEVARVLRPGGRFVFVEHVAAPPRTGARRLQRLLRRPWRWAFEGCVLCRDTEATIRGGAFVDVEVERFTVGGAWAPFGPHVAGTARC